MRVHLTDSRFGWTLWDLEREDRNAMRRHYRILRIAIYAPQSSEYARNGMYQGCYGMSRLEAKVFLVEFYRQICEHTYLGSK